MTPSGERSIHIGEKRAREEALDISPMKNEKQTSPDFKKKGPLPAPDDKKKMSAAKTTTKSKVTLCRATIQDIPIFVATEEETLVYPRVVLGLEAFTLCNPAMAKKFL